MEFLHYFLACRVVWRVFSGVVGVEVVLAVVGGVEETGAAVFVADWLAVSFWRRGCV